MWQLAWYVAVAIAFGIVGLHYLSEGADFMQEAFGKFKIQEEQAEESAPHKGDEVPEIKKEPPTKQLPIDGEM